MRALRIELFITILPHERQMLPTSGQYWQSSHKLTVLAAAVGDA